MLHRQTHFSTSCWVFLSEYLPPLSHKRSCLPPVWGIVKLKTINVITTATEFGEIRNSLGASLLMTCREMKLWQGQKGCKRRGGTGRGGKKRGCWGERVLRDGAPCRSMAARSDCDPTQAFRADSLRPVLVLQLTAHMITWGGSRPFSRVQCGKNGKRVGSCRGFYSLAFCTENTGPSVTSKQTSIIPVLNTHTHTHTCHLVPVLPHVKRCSAPCGITPSVFTSCKSSRQSLIGGHL